MVKAVEDDYWRRLHQDGPWGKPVRQREEEVDTTVREAIQALPIPDQVTAADPKFILTALKKLVSLIDEAPVEQE